MLVVGYVRHLLRAGETELEELPKWAQAAYPLGMAILVVNILLGSLWGWPGALRLGAWEFGLVSLILSGAVAIAFLRLPQRSLLTDRVQAIERWEARPARFAVFLQIFPRLARSLYQGIGQLIMYISALLEGDGGLLWTLLLLVLLASFLRGR